MSDSESDSDSSSSSSEEVKQTPTPVQPKAEESDSDSDSDSSSEDEKPAKKPAAVKIFAEAKKEESDSDSDSSDSEDEEKKPAAKPVAAKAAEDSDSSDSDSSDSEDEKKTEKKEVAKAAAPKKEESDSDSDSDSSDSEDEKPAKAAAAKPVAVEKKDDSDSDSSSDSEDEAPAAKKVEENDDEDDSSDADDEAEEAEPKKGEKMEVEEEKVDFTSSLAKTVTITPVFAWNVSESSRKGKKRKLESSTSPQVSKKAKAEDSSSTSESTATASEASGDMAPTKDFYATDYKNSHLKGKTSTIFIKGIDINAFETDIAEFFTDVEKPIQVRHKWFEDRPGIAFIQFSSPAVATKCVIDKNNEYIKARYINTDWAEERKKSVNTRGPRNAHLKDTTNRVWMGNLHREVQEENIIEYFSEVGVLTDVYIIGRDESRPKIAYISFESKELATKAVETCQAGSLLDYTVRLDWAEPRTNSGGGQKRKRELSEKPDGCVTCFVGRLSDDVDDEKIKELFKDAGEITQIRYLEKEGVFRGSAFIEFAESDSTDKAVALNGSSFLDRQIRVDYAEQSNKKRDTGGW